MLGHKRIPSREGGIEVVVQELGARLVELGCEVTCYNRGGHHVSGKEFDTGNAKEYMGIRLKSVLTIDKKGLAAMTSSFFGAICCAFGKYDVVHFHAEGPAFMCWLPKLFGKRVVVTVHGLDHQRAKWGRLASAYIMAGERNAVKYADEIIVLSESVRQYFKDTYGRDTVCIPNGVKRPEKMRAELIRERYQLEQDSYILFLGRIVPEKGLRYLLEAFQSVQTEKKLVIAGGSSDTDGFLGELKGMAEADPRILFTGFVQGRPLEELYSSAYVYVLPSDLEGMPLSLLEAMSYGNCCLVSDIPECADVIEDHGVTFRRGNAQDLRDKLQMLCDGPEAVERYSLEAADFICGKYAWDDMARETLDLYGRLYGG
ncbi:MAG: glycosyltransferase family 4 protein [Clostridiales bacterium]|nr:glycosyltransferase family 4 protein [Clostridiales bacterium]